LDNSSTDRRAHPRFTRELEIESENGSGTVVARMVSRNLSLGGLSCTSSVDIPEMTRLSVRLMLPRSPLPNASVEPLDVEAVVVRREEVESRTGGDGRYELALFFPHLEHEQKRRLQSFLGSVDRSAH
jgi:hypothetical protein